MRPYYLVIGLVAAGLMMACGGDDDPTATPAAATPTPDIQATVVAEVRNRQSTAAATPTPVALSTRAREAILAFAGSHREIVDDWETLHIDFDDWRQGLTACEPTTVQAALRQFAATMDRVAAQAAALPRPHSLRALADGLVTSTESEAASVRRLRDGWHPNDATLFRGVDDARSSALATIK